MDTKVLLALLVLGLLNVACAGVVWGIGAGIVLLGTLGVLGTIGYALADHLETIRTILTEETRRRNGL